MKSTNYTKEQDTTKHKKEEIYADYTARQIADKKEEIYKTLKDAMFEAGGSKIITSMFEAIVNLLRSQVAIYYEAGDSDSANVVENLLEDVYSLAEYGKALAVMIESAIIIDNLKDRAR